MERIRINLREHDYPCKIKNCINKKRNGRCKLSTIFFSEDYSICFDFEEREDKKDSAVPLNNARTVICNTS